MGIGGFVRIRYRKLGLSAPENPFGARCVAGERKGKCRVGNNSVACLLQVYEQIPPPESGKEDGGKLILRGGNAKSRLPL